MDFISLALWTLFIVVIFAILSICHRQYVIRQKFKHFPQTPGYPFIGVTFELINLSEYDRLKWHIKYMKKYYKEGIFVQWIGSKPIIYIFKPEYFQLIFSNTINITKGKFYEMIRLWLGNGLLTSSGKQWSHDRKLIGPTFHFSILDQFAVVQSEKAEILTKCFEREIENNPEKAIDIFPFVLNGALDIICETAMGVNIHAQDISTKYVSALQHISILIGNRMLQPWHWIDWIYYSLPVGKEFKSAVDIMHEFAKGVINRKKAERESQNRYTKRESEDNEFDIGKQKRKAFLDLLLDENAKADTPLTDDELRAQVDTFMFAGHDTTSVAVTWALFLLGNYLEHQEKVHEELNEVFGDSETPANVKELSQLKYLERVIKETLRIFPSAPIISREIVEDVKMDNYVIPKNTTVMLGILLAHRNPEVWSDPLKFDPDRFLPENSKNRNPYAYVPFSAGPRNCIGQRFAQLEVKILLTAILRKWRVKSVETVDTIKYGINITLRPQEKVLIHFTSKKRTVCQ